MKPQKPAIPDQATTYFERETKRIMDGLYPPLYAVQQMRMVRDYIDRHYANRLTSKKLSSIACYSRFHFLRLFRLSFHCSPHEYLTAVRITQARKMLAEGFPVSEVCFAVGFCSTSSFKLLFKKYTNRTPQAYREYVWRTKRKKSCPQPILLRFYKKAIFDIGDQVENPQFYSPKN